MTDELNQVQENNDFLSAMETEDDSVVDTPVETEESVEEPTEKPEEVVEETTVAEEPTEATAKPFLEIKYNKETKGLSQEEAKELAQKGMNYDRVNEKYTSLNGQLEKLAKLNGLGVEEYLNKLSDVEIEKNAMDELESLKEKYPDSPEEVLKELAFKRANEKQELQFKRFEEEQNGKDDALKAEVQRQVDLFKKEYPDLDPSGLDASVYDFVKDGYTLLEAYQKYMHIQEEINRPAIEAKQKTDKLNESNKKKSLGNITNVGDEEGNDFFKGLDSMI